MLTKVLGSSMSRSPSPVRLNASTITVMASPGHTSSWGAWSRNVLASDSMAPHSGVGGGDAEPEEGQPRHGKQYPAHVERAEHHDQPHQIGENVARGDPRPGCPQPPGCLDELPLAHLKG